MPVRAVSAATQQLPAEPNEFIGRAAELHFLSTLIGGTQLITLVGPAGVGKTRLALRAAAQAEPSFADGACLVELSALRDPLLLANTVADRLGLAEQSAASRRDAVIGHLRDRHLLLILDACEHLIDGVAELAEAVLAVAPGVTLVATSREPLDVAGEHCLFVAPLPVRASGGRITPDSVELFVRRAGRTIGGFAVTEENGADVLRVCQLLEGIPLAIELAAMQLASLPVGELADRLERRLPLLRDSRGGSTGHPTLREAVGWSYELCTSTEQALWARLSVFQDGFDLDAAAEVCASATLPSHQVRETMIQLAGKSVVRPSHTRYLMLDTIREFGAERLAASGSETAVRDRHVARHLAKARHFREHFLDDEQLTLIGELRSEHANLRAALAYTLADGAGRSHSTVEGAEIAVGLAGYWQAACLQREGMYWLDRVLDQFPASGPERAEALAVRCYLGTTAGQAAEAAADGRESVRLATELGDEAIAARGCLFLAHALSVTGEFGAATEAGAEAETLLRHCGDRVGLLILPAHMAHLHQLAGNLAEADTWYRRGVELFGPTRERWLTGWLHLIGGFTFLQLPGREADCARAFQLALAAKHEAGDIVGTGYALEALAGLAARTGRNRRVGWLLGAADPVWQRAGAVLSNSPSLVGLHELVRGQTREALGAATFDALFRRGAALTLDQAVALAIDDADEVPGGARP